MATKTVDGRPRSIPGPTHPSNSRAFDWGPNGAVAYGCGANVVVVDPYSGQVIQMLVGGHREPITRVKVRSQRPTVSPALEIVSGDEAGVLNLWNASIGKVESKLEDKSKTSSKLTGKSIVDLSWISDGTGDAHILSLHSGTYLTMWNPESGDALWTMHTPEGIIGMATDHFDQSRICLVTHSFLIVVDDLTPEKPPGNLNNKFNVSGPTLRKSKPSLGTTSLMAYFSKLDRDILFLMFQREVLIMDLRTNQTIGQLVLERSGSAFQEIIPCSTISMVYCLHQNGCISARWRSRDIGSSYEVMGQSDALRLTKTSKILTMALSPLDDTAPALLTNDGKILFYKFSPPESVPILDSMLDLSAYIPLIQKDTFLLDHIVESISARIVCMAICPERLRSVNHYGDSPGNCLCAIGTTTGYIQIFDLSTCNLKRQYFVTSSCIRGFDWAAHSVVCFCSEPNNMTTPTFRNLVFKIDLRNGHVHRLLDIPDHLSSITAVKVSEMGQYLIVLFQDQPFELWDLPNVSLLKVMPTAFPRVADLVWSVTGLRKKGNSTTEDAVVGPLDQENKSTLSKEHLVVTTHEGLIAHFTVEGSVVRHGQRIPTDPVMGAITSLARKGDWIVTGDTEGILHFWDLKGKVSRSVISKRGSVKEIKFLPKRSSTRFLVLFTDGVEVWDALTADMISSRIVDPKFSSHEMTAVGIGWSSLGCPVVAYGEGTVHIFDAWLAVGTSAISSYSFSKPIKLIAASSSKIVQFAKSHMQHEQCNELVAVDSPEPPSTDPLDAGVDMDSNRRIETVALRAVHRMPAHFYSALVKASSIAERCLLTARIFGDIYEFKFWTLFLRYKKMQPEFEKLPRTTPRSTRSTPSDVRQLAQAVKQPSAGGNLAPSYEPAEVPESERLPSSFDILCDASDIRKQQLQRLKTSTSGGSQKDTSIQQHVLLGQHGNAIQMLLETQAQEDNFYVDSLRACIIAAIGSPDHCQNTVKLVAMNLIAAGKLDAGVELLCLVGCHLDACNYLQSEGHWQRAALLAKATLHPAACSEVLSRWVEHMQSSNKKSEAVLVCLSYGRWKRALAILNSMDAPNLTVLYAEACLQEGLLKLDDEGGAEEPHTNTIAARGALLQTVWMKAAKVAAMIGSRTLMQRYNLKFDASSESIA